MKTDTNFKPGPSMRMEYFFPDHSIEASNAKKGIALPDHLHRKREIRREINLKPGMWVSIIDCSPERKIAIRYDREETLINFGFVLSGTITNKIRSLHADKTDLKNPAGVGGIVLLPSPSGIIEIAPGKSAQIVHIHINKEFFRSALSFDLDHIHPELRTIIESDRRKPYIFRKTMPPSIRTVVNQIVYSVQSGIPERLFFEGKALELLSLEIGELNRSKGGYGKRAKILPDERERIIKAAELLVSDLESPPTLYDLARTVNLTIRRLEVGFRDVFNMSVFDFLRDYKMQRAQSLFLETGMNVSEVAWEVGYINVSHFSAAYRKKYGILPKGYVKELRGN